MEIDPSLHWFKNALLSAEDSISISEEEEEEEE